MTTNAERQSRRAAERFGKSFAEVILRHEAMPAAHQVPLDVLGPDMLISMHEDPYYQYTDGSASGVRYKPRGQDSVYPPIRFGFELTGDGEQWTEATCTVTFEDGTPSLTFQGRLQDGTIVVELVPQEGASSTPA